MSAHFWSKIRLAEILRLHNSTKSHIYTLDANRIQAITCLMFVLQKSTPSGSYFFSVKSFPAKLISRPSPQLSHHLPKHPVPPKAKSPTKKQEDVRPYATASRCDGTLEIPALNASSPRPRAPTTRSAMIRHR